MVKKLVFYITDVFAEERYSGNQLAVFRGAESISSGEMQRIAREINFSETAFILSDMPRQGGFAVRIFTPRQEVPFAGHPTLGTAHIIRSEILQGKPQSVVLNLKAGQIPVTFGRDGYGWMRQLEPEFGQEHKSDTIAAILGLAATAVDERYPIQEVSTGLPFFIVPLKNMAALKRAKIDKERYISFVKDAWAKGILVFCPQTHKPENNISVRVFVDYYGVPEDPATGSGNGCLAGYLVKHRYFGQERLDVRSEQGYEMGRPSLLLLRAEQSGSSMNVSVGGKAILVASGEFLCSD